MNSAIKCFIAAAGVLLLVTAFVRLWIGFSGTPILSLPEPCLGISVRNAVLLVGLLEVFVAMVCLFGRRTTVQLGLLAWLGMIYVAYWSALSLIHLNWQTSCIGFLTDPLHFTHGSMGPIIQWLPLLVLFGSLAALVWILQVEPKLILHRRERLEMLKMSCPGCGGHIQFSRQNVGQRIACPHCQKEIALRRLENLKMSCFFCQGHIEFPAHAIGEKMPCPHCKMDITLKEAA